jgi:hypothetical protein
MIVKYRGVAHQPKLMIRRLPASSVALLPIDVAIYLTLEALGLLVLSLRSIHLTTLTRQEEAI